MSEATGAAAVRALRGNEVRWAQQQQQARRNAARLAVERSVLQQ